MSTFTFFHEFKLNLGLKLIELETDTFKWALTNSAPTAATHDELADITQIANGNGYTTGGETAANNTYTETAGGSGIWKFTHDDVVWTASGGSIAQFRYAVLYSDTSTGDKLVGYLDYGSAVDITVGNTFTLDVGSDGVFQLT